MNAQPVSRKRPNWVVLGIAIILIAAAIAALVVIPSPIDTTHATNDSIPATLTLPPATPPGQ
jgi:membrane protein YdbS with pleckstrin-like domain